MKAYCCVGMLLMNLAYAIFIKEINIWFSLRALLSCTRITWVGLLKTPASSYRSLIKSVKIFTNFPIDPSSKKKVISVVVGQKLKMDGYSLKKYVYTVFKYSLYFFRLSHKLSENSVY